MSTPLTPCYGQYDDMNGRKGKGVEGEDPYFPAFRFSDLVQSGRPFKLVRVSMSKNLRVEIL